MLRLFLLTVAFAGLAEAAQAQVWLPPPGATEFDRHRWEVDRHQAAIGGLRAGADARDALAARTQADARAAAARIEAGRAAPLPYPSPWAPPPGPSTPSTPRRDQGGFPPPPSGGDVTQIDAWLDRRD